MKIRGCTFLAGLFTAVVAQATILPPTGSSTIPPAAHPAALTGEYHAAVHADPGTTFCAGCLDSFITVIHNSTPADPIERITEAAFGASRTNAGRIDPAAVDRSSNGSVSSFDFSEPSGSVGIEANSRTLAAGTQQSVDGSVASVNAFATCMVPEASSISLTFLGGAFLGLGLLRRRRVK